MTVELVLILAASWVLLGLIDAWVLHQLGRSGWPLVALCAIAGPLSLSIVYDEVRPTDSDNADPQAAIQPDTQVPAASDQAPLDNAEPAPSALDDSVGWPDDDPEGPFILQGYRGLSDH